MNHKEILNLFVSALQEGLTVDELAELFSAISNEDIRNAIYAAWLLKVDEE